MRQNFKSAIEQKRCNKGWPEGLSSCCKYVTELEFGSISEILKILKKERILLINRNLKIIKRV